MLSFLILPLIIVAFIALFKNIRSKRDGRPGDAWFFMIAFSKEDFLKQLFYLLGLAFFSLTLFAFNRDLGEPFAWKSILLLSAVVGFGIAYYFKAFYVLPVSIFGLSTWVGVKCYDWTDGADIKTVAIMSALVFLALFYYAIGRIHESQARFKRYSLVYSVVGLVSVTGILFFLSTRAGLYALESMTEGLPVISSWRLSFLWLGLLGLTMAAIYWGFRRDWLPSYEAAALWLLTFLFTLSAILPNQDLINGSRDWYSSGTDFTFSGIVWAFFFNLLIFAELIGIILSGYAGKESWRVNLGAFFVFVLILVKYFDWFFEFFDKSLFFISAGILFFLVGWFMEKGRRYMLATMKFEEKKEILQ